MFLLSETLSHSSSKGLYYEASCEGVICVVLRVCRAQRMKELVAVYTDDNSVDDGIHKLKSLVDMEKDICGDVKYLHLDGGRVYTFRDRSNDYLLVFADASEINSYLENGSWSCI